MSEAPTTPARPVLPSEASDVVNLREFEQRLYAFSQQMNERTRYEREVLEVRQAALEKALDLQALEYQRRLSELNHSHELAATNWQRSLQREAFDGVMAEWGKWRDGVNTQVVTLVQTSTRLAQLEVAIRTAESQLIVLNQQIAAKIALGDRVKKVEDAQNSSAYIAPTVAAFQERLKTIEVAHAQAVGGIALIRFMGFAGVLGLVITFLRLMKVLP